jgi:hypothetical protein
MNLTRLSRLIVVSLLLLTIPGTAGAQGGWDATQWLELVEQGDNLYQQAVETDEDDDESYRGYLRESLRYKQQALEMLRRALLLHQIEAVEQLSADANRDLFNLAENVIVILLELDQCDAGELMLDRALGDPDLLPEGGVVHLESLRSEFQDCRVQVAESGAAVFDYDRLSSLILAAEQWREAALIRDAGDTMGRSGDLFESSYAYVEAIGLLNVGLTSGLLIDPDGEHESTLYALHNELITVLLDVNSCDAAQRRVNVAMEVAASMPLGDPAMFTPRQTDIADCQDRYQASLSQTPEQVIVEVERGPNHPPLAQRADVGDAPYVLFGVAGATFLTAIVIDLLSAGDRDDLDTARAQCPDGDCDFERVQELADSVNSDKVAVGILTGATIVTAAIGTMLYLTSQESPARASAPTTDDDIGAGTPVFSLDGLGASLRINF